MAEVAARPWHLITCEYPPQVGGVGEYTRVIARGLAGAGMSPHVWCPRPPEAATPTPGVSVHQEAGRWGLADLRRVGRMLDEFPPPRRLVVQWVPQGYGCRSLNVAFCLWVWGRAWKRDTVELMVHEPFLAFHEGSWRQDVAAAVHRAMTMILLSAARRVWVSTPAWATALKPYAFGARVGLCWAPVPSNVPPIRDEAAVGVIRRQMVGAGSVLIGHFGTYGRLITALLTPLVEQVAKAIPRCTVLLLGAHSDAFCRALTASVPQLEGRVRATGALSLKELSLHLQACDLLVQPYPDGVTTRRGTVMAALAHAKPVVTTAGRLTEPLWQETGAVRLVPVESLPAAVGAIRQLAADESERRRLGERARQTYQQRFDVRHTVEALLRAMDAPGSPECRPYV